MITGLFAALLVLLYVKLALKVIKLRGALKVSLGDGGHSPLEQAIRAHANFAEYAPIGLFMLALIELNQAPMWFVGVLGCVLVMGRVIHAWAFSTIPENHIKFRVLGMKITLGFLLISAAVLCIQFMMGLL
jgi:hypothetical protein